MVYSCANIVPPDGGPKDETPPVLLSIVPGDSLLNSKVAKIELRFNKFVVIQDLEKNMQLAPLLQNSPSVLSYGKRVVIRIADSLLQDNTTYRISLGNAIVDNRESTPFGNFTYTFSTGGYFDSLQINGSIIDAATGLPDTAATIVLYPSAENDSAVLRKKPLYVVKANTSGKFTIPSLPAKQFKVYALYDESGNYIFDGEKEKIGFLPDLVMPHTPDDTAASKDLEFYIFRQERDTTRLKAGVSTSDTLSADTLARSGKGGSRGAGNRRKAAAVKSGYVVNADTSSRERRTQEINKPLTISIHAELSMLDTGKVYLSYDNNGVEVEAIQNTTMDSGTLTLTTKWFPDRIYTLRLVKGWAKDTAGAELAPGKYIFRTKREDDYGMVRVRVNSAYRGEQYLLYIYKGADSVYQKPVRDSTVVLSLLQPGDYGMRIIIDENRNGKWDTGDLFAKKQPEKVIPYYGTINLKAGWEHEVDFLPPDKQEKLSPLKKSHEQERGDNEFRR